MELIDTIGLMVGETHRERFIAEYYQTKIRYSKLKHLCNKIEVAKMMDTEPPRHECPDDLLFNQLEIMREYLDCLEKRAIIEGINLKESYHMCNFGKLL